MRGRDGRFTPAPPCLPVLRRALSDFRAVGMELWILWIQGWEATVSRRDSRGWDKKSITRFGLYHNGIYTDFVDKGVYRKEYQHMITKLRQARIESGFIQSQVAKKLGKPQSYVSKVEVGQRRLDPMELTQFAKIYKKPITYFIK